MASLRYHLASGEVTLAAANTAKQCMYIKAPANQKVVIEKIIVSTNSVTTTDPPSTLDICVGSGTVGGGASITPAKINPLDTETIQVTATSGSTAITGITPGDILSQDYIPNNGSRQNILPPGREIVIPGGGAIVIVITSGGTITGTVKARVNLDCHE